MRKVLLVVLLALVAFPVMAQDVTPEAGFELTTFEWTCPEGFAGQTLNIYNWSTYVAPDTISNFEAACGVTVNYDIYGSGDELLSRLRQGNPGYDLVVPPDQSIEIMVTEGLLEPLDLTQIPNFANLKESLTNEPYDPGNQYTIPYQWGTIGVGYDRNKVGADITSWNQVWDYAGPVAWLEDKRPIIGVALLMLSYDPNTTDLDQLQEAKNYLIEKGANVVSIAADDGQEQLARGEVDIVIEFMGDIYQVQNACAADPACTQDIQYALPEEGANIWIDNMAIPTGALNPLLAHAFMDYILDPNVGASISNFTFYATPNQASVDAGLILPELLESPTIYPTDEIVERLFFIAPNLEVEDNFELGYSAVWDEIKIEVGG
jgi:spermidine/putrescine transport system substrate-binding protein